MRYLVRNNVTLDDLDGLFDDLFRSFSALPRLPTNPTTGVDVYSEDGHTMVVELCAPGFDSEDITIDIGDGVLDIRGERSNKEDEKRAYAIRDNPRSFTRRILIPEGADSEKISAELENGILKVMIPVERKDVERIAIEAQKTKQLKSTVAAT